MTNYSTMVKRIKKATSKEDIGRLDKSLARLFLVGVFTIKEYQRLDLLLVDRLVVLEEQD